ncbi:histidine phosphatase family protein [Vibrio agarivorans]|uniref:histidine phosphatase family protein n=1 Tax=Vibrio agarivorans TaxID=153622 RepID=UPI002231F88F|nr:histidine phosphatase family protein [Vibrio agarivorans]
MANIYLIRHGKVSGAPALYGHTDVPVDRHIQCVLSENVEAKFSFSRVVTSPLIRCSELAHQIVEHNPELSLHVEPALMEMNFGDLDGVPFEKLGQLSDTLDAFSRSPIDSPLPNGETLSGFYNRVIRVWQRLVQNTHEDTLLITHGGVIRVILAHTLKMNWQAPELYQRLQIANGSMTHLETLPQFDGWVTVKSIGLSLTDIAAKVDD